MRMWIPLTLGLVLLTNVVFLALANPAHGEYVCFWPVGGGGVHFCGYEDPECQCSHYIIAPEISKGSKITLSNNDSKSALDDYIKILFANPPEELKNIVKQLITSNKSSVEINNTLIIKNPPNDVKNTIDKALAIKK
jgi:hypothetical protein